MKIIICGATGFIGSNLLKHFDNGKNEIFAIYNNRPPIEKSSKNINWFKADLRKLSNCQRYFSFLRVIYLVF